MTNKINPKTVLHLTRIHPDIKMRFFKIATELYHWSQGTLTLKITDSLRSFEEQEMLYKKGRTGPGKRVTNAKPGESAHNYGLAFDVAFEGSDPYLESRIDSKEIWLRYGSICESNHMLWGGKFVTIDDNPHAEKTYGLTMRQLEEHYLEHGLASLWGRIDDIILGYV